MTKKYFSRITAMLLAVFVAFGMICFNTGEVNAKSSWYVALPDTMYVGMEGYSVEDNGAEICFNVFAYNAQPHVTIDYATGESSLSNQKREETPKTDVSQIYIINKNSKKFHLPNCSSVGDMKPQNKKESNNSIEELKKQGYTPCKSCIG